MRKLPQAPLSSDAEHIARSLDFASKDIRTFLADPRLGEQSLSQQYIGDQAGYYATMAEHWRELARRMKERGC